MRWPGCCNGWAEPASPGHGRAVQGFAPEALEALRNHSWPGNIRELENVVEHAFVIEASDLITQDSLPASVRQGATPTSTSTGQTATAPHRDDTRVSVSVPLDFQSSKEAFEREFLIQALKKFKGRINQTALQANIPKKTLLRKLEKYGINARDYSGG